MVSVYILIPELAKRTDGAQKRYLDTVIAGFSIFACLVSGGAMLFAPPLLEKLFPQLVAEGMLPTLVILTRIILLQPIFLGLSNILAAVTQARHRYTLYALSPLLYNLGIILGVGVFYPLFGVTGLAWGVVVGSILHVSVQVPSVMKDGFFRRLPRVSEPRALLDTVIVSLPRALALSMSQIAFLGLTALAGLLTSGSIAIFMLAYNLQAVPLAVIGASYSVAAFPTLAAALSAGRRDAFLSHVATAARYVFFWSLPASALMVVLRAHMVRVILGSGNFDWTDTRLTAAVFALLGLSLAAQGLTLLLIRGYYAAGRTFIPFLVSCATALATVLLGFGFIALFKHPGALGFMQDLMRLRDVPGSTVLALGLAYAIATIAGAYALAWHFDRRHGGFFKRVSRAWTESAIAAICAMTAAYVVLFLVGPLETASTTLSVFLKGFAGGAAGIIVATATYWLLGSKELQETALALRGRFFREAIPPAAGVALASPQEETPQS
jgi:putative peptidoglycan lipid II flippase